MIRGAFQSFPEVPAAGAGRTLKPLAGGDFGGGSKAAGTLKALNPADFVPGAKVAAAGPDDAHGRVTDQAQKLVAQTFFGVLLKQMRDSPFKSELFDGGRGGQAFSSLYDQHMVERMAKASGKKLAGAIARQLEGRRAYGNSKSHTEEGGERRGPHAPDANDLQVPPAPADDTTDGTPAERQTPRHNPWKDVKVHVAPALRG